MSTSKHGGLRFFRIGPMGGSFYCRGPGLDWRMVAVGVFFGSMLTLQLLLVVS